MSAAGKGRTDVVKMLHAFGADVNHQDEVSCYYTIDQILVGLCDNEKTYISIISITKTHFITINDIISIMNIVF